MNLFRRAHRAAVRVGGYRLSSGGFTAVELMVTIGLIALIGGATVASMDAYLRKTSIQKAAVQIAGELYNAKTRAFRTKQTCTVAFDNVNHTYQSADPNPNPLFNLSDLRGNVTFTVNPDPGTPANTFMAVMGFNFLGLSTDNNPRQIYLQGVDGAGNVYRIYRIQVLPVGAISIRYWQPTTNTWVQ